jgi:hypothetical protein
VAELLVVCPPVAQVVAVDSITRAAAEEAEEDIMAAAEEEAADHRVVA